MLIQQQKALLFKLFEFIEKTEKSALFSPKETLLELQAMVQDGDGEKTSVSETDEPELMLAKQALSLVMQARCLNLLSENNDAIEKIMQAKNKLEALPKGSLIAKYVHSKAAEQLGIAKWALRENLQALTLLEEAMGYHQEIDIKEDYFNAMNTKACIHATMSDYANALMLWVNAEKYFESTNNKHRQARVLHNISGIYYDSGEYDLANSISTKAINLLDNNDSPQLIEMLNARGLINLKNKRYDEAKADFQRALQLSQKYNNIDGQLTAMAGTGKIYLENNDLEESLRIYSQALEQRFAKKGAVAELDILSGIAKVYERKGQWLNAKAYYEALRLAAEDQQAELELSIAYQGLSRVAEAEGDFKTALALHKNYAQYFAQAIEKRTNERQQGLKATFLAEQAQKESEKLKRLNEQLFKAHDALSEIISQIELQKADLELQYARMAELISLLSEGVLIEDENRKTHLVNQRLLDLFEIEGNPKAFIGKSADRLRAFVRKKVKDAKSERAFFEQCFYERKAFIGKEVSQLNGKVYEFSFIPLFNKGVYRGCLWIFEDITLRKVRERERELTIQRLNEANEKLKKASNLKNEMLNIAVHDLKNPLNVVIGFAELLKNEPCNEEIKTSYLQSISHSAKRMLAIVQDLLNAAQNEQDDLQLELKPINVNQIVAYVFSNQEVLAREKNIAMHFEEKACAKIKADAGKFYEIIENLVSNAIKYSPPNKSVTVTIEKISHEQSRMRRQSDMEKNRFGVVRISVKDEGQGLNENDMKKLFQPFQKLSSKPTGKEHSTGLGLFIVKSLVEKHHGKIWAHSEGKGKGATFFLEFSACE